MKKNTLQQISYIRRREALKRKRDAATFDFIFWTAALYFAAVLMLFYQL